MGKHSSAFVTHRTYLIDREDLPIISSGFIVVVVKRVHLHERSNRIVDVTSSICFKGTEWPTGKHDHMNEPDRQTRTSGAIGRRTHVRLSLIHI